MKNLVLFCVLISFLSCKRECDCEQQNSKFFHSDVIDLPVKSQIQEPTEFDLVVYIEENNSLKLDKTEMTIEQIDSSIVETLEHNASATLKVFPHPKSNFEVFNNLLNLTKSHNLKLVIGQEQID